jgi:thymidylate kinase
MPQPDLLFYLDAAPAVLLSQKQDISYEALEKSRTRYLDWVDSNANCVRIDAERLLAFVVDDVFKRIETLSLKNK